jgi:periplasmic protein TonB
MRSPVCLVLLLAISSAHALPAQSSAPASEKDQPSLPPGVYKVGAGITPPRATYAPNPEYSDKARRAKVNGIVIVSLIVTPEGNTRDVQIVQSLTPDLDKKAVEAVKKWKFQPATKDGEPVAVRIKVETDFRLY